MNRPLPQDSWLVQGGAMLRGTLRPAGSKNAALPELAACLLTDRPVRLEGLPAIRDVRSMLDLLESLGVEIDEQPDAVTLTASGVDPGRLDFDSAKAIRASILLAGPLLARCGRLELPPPGGDVIGRRRLDSHFISLEALGAIVDHSESSYRFEGASLAGAEMLLDEPSVTATENVMMAACVVPGRTVVYNAACEPNVQDLAILLREMGAVIEGAGTNRLVIEGRGGLLGGASHRVAPDHIEVGSFIGLAACCGEGIRITGVGPSITGPTMNGLGKLGVRIGQDGEDIVVEGGGHLEVVCDRGGAIPTVYDAPWPGFSPDLTSTAVVTATQAKGTSLVFEKMFESRLFFVDKLVAMGASIILCDPHRVVVAGPSRLHGTDVASPDIRAGMALLTAALCADGPSVIRNVHQIERGYENLVDRLRGLGAMIEAGPPA